MSNKRLEMLFNNAIEVLKEYEPAEGYFVAFSGGKDSIVIYDLMKRSGCKFDAHFNYTTVDPPEVLEFIKRYYPDVIWERPKDSMFTLIRKWGLPNRLRRWCCRLLKEYSGTGRGGCYWNKKSRKQFKK